MPYFSTRYGPASTIEREVDDDGHRRDGPCALHPVTCSGDVSRIRGMKQTASGVRMAESAGHIRRGKSEM